MRFIISEGGVCGKKVCLEHQTFFRRGGGGGGGCEHLGTKLGKYIASYTKLSKQPSIFKDLVVTADCTLLFHLQVFHGQFWMLWKMLSYPKTLVS